MDVNFTNSIIFDNPVSDHLVPQVVASAVQRDAEHIPPLGRCRTDLCLPADDVALFVFIVNFIAVCGRRLGKMMLMTPM